MNQRLANTTKLSLLALLYLAACGKVTERGSADLLESEGGACSIRYKRDKNQLVFTAQAPMDQSRLGIYIDKIGSIEMGDTLSGDRTRVSHFQMLPNSITFDGLVFSGLDPGPHATRITWDVSSSVTGESDHCEVNFQSP